MCSYWKVSSGFGSPRLYTDTLSALTLSHRSWGKPPSLHYREASREKKRLLIRFWHTLLESISFPLLFSHLHIKEGRSVSRPLFDNAHIFKHGLMLRHALQPSPLLQNTGPCGGCLLLDPHLQHLLLLHLQQHRSANQWGMSQSISQSYSDPVCQEVQLSFRKPDWFDWTHGQSTEWDMNANHFRDFTLCHHMVMKNTATRHRLDIRAQIHNKYFLGPGRLFTEYVRNVILYS